MKCTHNLSPTTKIQKSPSILSQQQPKKKMSAACRAWVVAASIGAVEALKDQGVCRWNGVLRSVHQHAKNNMRSYSQAKKLSDPSSSAISMTMKRSQEEKVKKIMELSCWGPNTVRF
ncbi:uncharacterized protein [Pyrus communis]|uniref:uncharacterized protein n=1 Tax=Pyrus communis TaxID=23211 RepID=UPI0035C1395A